MRILLSLLPMAGCAVMMAVCMGRIGRHREGDAPVPAAEEDITALRAEVARLRAERSPVPSEPVDG